MVACVCVCVCVYFAVRSKANLHFDKDNVETRQKGLSTQYSKLCKLSQVCIAASLKPRSLPHAELDVCRWASSGDDDGDGGAGDDDDEKVQ